MISQIDSTFNLLYAMVLSANGCELEENDYRIASVLEDIVV